MKKKVKVSISKQDWIASTLGFFGRFYCPRNLQQGLLDAWPDETQIRIDATIGDTGMSRKNPRKCNHKWINSKYGDCVLTCSSCHAYLVPNSLENLFISGEKRGGKYGK